MAQKFGVKEVLDVTFYSTTTKKPVLHLDTLKLSNLENTAQEVSAKGGKGNPELLSWDFGREANFKVQDALMSFESLGLLTGNEAIVHSGTAKATIRAREELVIGAGGTVALRAVPTVSSDYPMVVFIKQDDGSDKELAKVASNPVSRTSYTFAGGVTTVGFNVSDAGETAIIFYAYEVSSGKTIKVTSNAFPGYYIMVGDTVIRNEATGLDEAFQLTVPKCKLLPNFTLNFSAEGEPSVFDMDLKVFKEGGGSEDMVIMTKY